MAVTERIIFQPYTAGTGDRLLPGEAVLCRTVENAQRRAEKAVAAAASSAPTSSVYWTMRRPATTGNPNTSRHSAVCPTPSDATLVSAQHAIVRCG